MHRFLFAVCRAWRYPASMLALVFALTGGLSHAHAQDTYTLSDGGWEQQAAPDPDSPEGKLRTVRKLIASGAAKDAIKQSDAWIEAHPNHPMLVEAYLLRGDAKVAKGDYYEALFDYEYLVRVFPGSEQFPTALEREYEIARMYSTGTKRKLLGMRILTASGEAEELFIRIQERAPGSDVGERASLALANHYYEAGRMPLAAEAYDLFLVNYPESPTREWAMLRLIQANLARFNGPAFDPTGLIEARQLLEGYGKEYPAAAERIGSKALIVRINESLATKQLLQADWYRKRRENVSAAYVYRRLVEEYPQTGAAAEAVRTLQEMGEPVQVKTPEPEAAAEEGVAK